MIYTFDILDEKDLSFIVDIFDVSDFKGGLTSSGFVVDLKNNLEMCSDYDLKTLQKYIAGKINQSNDFRGILIPKHYAGILFSKYETGMYYNSHNDDYSMFNGFRTDYSITIFLNDPDEYEGGELVLTLGNQELPYKLKAGQCLAYPTGLKHKVNMVTSGIRKVCVMWVESCIQDIDIRNILADYYLISAKYGEDILEKLGLDAHNDIVNINNKLMRKFGTFRGVV